MTKARDLASAIPAPSTVSSAELGYLDGVTSAIQTQLDAKTAKSTLTTTGDIYYASAANTPARLGIGSTDQVLKVTAGVPAWATASSGALTKIVSTTFSNVSSQSFQNCFSGTYRSYFIEFSNMYDSGAAAQPDFYINWLKPDNTDIGNGRYYGGTMSISTTGVATTGQTSNGNSSMWKWGKFSGLSSGGFLNVSAAGSLGAFNNEYRNFTAQGIFMQAGEDYRSWIGGAAISGNFTVAGFSVSLSGGTIYGTITVYGVEN